MAINGEGGWVGGWGGRWVGGWGNRWAGFGGTWPGKSQPQLFEKSTENPLGEPS